MILARIAKMYFKPSSAIRYTPYLLIIPIIVFLSLSLTGCTSTSPAIPNIYIVSLRSNTNATEDPVQVRIGYYGICGIDEAGTRCQSARGRSVEELAVNLFPLPGANETSNAASSDADIADLITTALNLQSESFMSVLATAAVLFVLGVVAELVYKLDVRRANWLDHPRRSAIIRRATYGSLFLATGLLFAAALATDQAADALEFASAGMKNASVLIKSGTTLQVLQWMAFGFSLVFTLTVPFLVRPKESGAEAYKEEA